MLIPNTLSEGFDSTDHMHLMIWGRAAIVVLSHKK